MDKVRSKYKETRCTCITDLAKGQNKKQHRPTGVETLSRNSFSLKSVVHVHRVSLNFDLTLSIKAHHISNESNSYMLRVYVSTEWHGW